MTYNSFDAIIGFLEGDILAAKEIAAVSLILGMLI
jgi:hypothetical protein